MASFFCAFPTPMTPKEPPLLSGAHQRDRAGSAACLPNFGLAGHLDWLEVVTPWTAWYRIDQWLACTHTEKTTFVVCGVWEGTWRLTENPKKADMLQDRSGRDQGLLQPGTHGPWTTSWEGLAIHHRPPGLKKAVRRKPCLPSTRHATPSNPEGESRLSRRQAERESRCWMLDIRQVLRFFSCPACSPGWQDRLVSHATWGTHANCKVTSRPSTLPVARMSV